VTGFSQSFDKVALRLDVVFDDENAHVYTSEAFSPDFIRRRVHPTRKSAAGEQPAAAI